MAAMAGGGGAASSPSASRQQQQRQLLQQHQRRRYNPYFHFRPILHSILRFNRSAAEHRNDAGQYPLNILVDRGSTWCGGGVDKVFKAYPGALFSYDLSNGVFAMAVARAAEVPDIAPPPGMNSSTHAKVVGIEKAACIGALFQLLKGKPTLLEPAVSTFGAEREGSKGEGENGPVRKRRRVELD